MRGTETVFLAGPGGGKSMALAQVACEGVRTGFHVAVATLEIPEPIWLARIKANLTGLLIDDIMDDPDGVQAQKRLAEFQAKPGMGRIFVKEFSPMATTVEDLKAWIQTSEDDLGFPVQVLVIDYADKLIAPGKMEDTSGYTLGKVVYEGLRVWAAESSRWLYTASQSTRNDGKKASSKHGIDDMADSMHKGRVADAVISLNVRDDMIAYHIAKNRLGVSGKSTGPIPTEFERGRIAPLNAF